MISPLLWIPILAALWVVQSIFVYFQGKAFAHRISMLRHEGRVAVGLGKNRIGVRTFAMVVVDRADRVVRVETMAGVSVFARPRSLPRYAGLPITELSDVVRSHKAKKNFQAAVDQAVRALTSSELEAGGAVMPTDSRTVDASIELEREGGGPIAQCI